MAFGSGVVGNGRALAADQRAEVGWRVGEGPVFQEEEGRRLEPLDFLHSLDGIFPSGEQRPRK